MFMQNALIINTSVCQYQEGINMDIEIPHDLNFLLSSVGLNKISAKFLISEATWKTAK